MRIEARKNYHETYILEKKLNNAVKNKDWEELNKLTDRELNPEIVNWTLFLHLDFWTEYDDLYKELKFLKDRWWIQCKVREEVNEMDDMEEDIDDKIDDLEEPRECGEPDDDDNNCNRA